MAPTIRCAFCDQVREEAEEDLISRWAGTVLRTLYGPKLDIVHSTWQLDADGATVVQHAHKRRQTYSAVKLKGVCRTCNNVWMSQIENAAKPIVEPMIRGRRTGIPVRDQRTLATWLTLKTLEADLIPHNAPTSATADFHAFYSTPAPPPGFTADLGYINLQGKPDLYYHINPHTAASPIGGVATGQPLCVEFSFSLGPVFFQTAYINVAGRQYPEPCLSG